MVMIRDFYLWVKTYRWVPYFGGHFCPILGQGKDKFLSRNVSTFFDDNNLNQFYIHIISVGIT